MKLRFLNETYSVCQLAPDADIPNWLKGEFVAILRTDEELTIVAPSSSMPAPFVHSDQTQVSPDWKCFRVCSELEFDIVGVIAGISKVLAEAKISIFSLSTYNTDYFLVSQTSVQSTKQALTNAGYTFED